MLKTVQNDSYINGIDGLRAFAVLAVLFYHFGFTWAGGGFLGVDAFFVISGYLITSNIIKQKSKFSLREFWIRRIRRLFPAAYIMIIAVFAWTAIFRPDILKTIQGDAAAAFVYMSNWWLIFHKVSYFDSFDPTPIKNLWSLAIEEQFYITWPILFVIGRKASKKKFSTMILIAALCSAILMAVFYVPGEDPSRVYYGTDTRAFELLIGCWLAVVYPIKNRFTSHTSVRKKRIFNIAGTVAFMIFIISVAFINEYNVLLYRGGLLLFDLNTAALMVCICAMGTFWGRFLSWRLLSWIGKRSYGIYLWHYPIFVLSTPVNEIGNPNYLRIAIQFIITFVIAEISYCFIEMPIRKYGLKETVKRYFIIDFTKTRRVEEMSSSNRRRYSVRWVPVICIIVVIGLVGVTACARNMQNDKQKASKVNASAITGTNQSSLSKSSGENSESSSEAVHSAAQKSYKRVLAIGDSVMLDISSSLNNKYTNITVDGKVGRQLYQAVKLAPNYSKFNSSNDAVIIELGTNGYFSDSQLNDLLDCFSKAHIYLVNTRVPRQWERSVNNSLSKIVKERNNITLIDWHSAAINHPEYFAKDGVHLMTSGIKALVSLIDKALSGGIN